MTGALTTAVLECALAHQTPQILLSEQGLQYAATDYVDRLPRRGIKVSMAAREQPRQNAFTDRLKHTVKDMEVFPHDYADLTEARARIGWFLDDLYITRRPLGPGLPVVGRVRGRCGSPAFGVHHNTKYPFVDCGDCRKRLPLTCQSQ